MRVLTTVGLFVASAAAAVALTTPQIAASAIRAISSSGCFSQNDGNGRYLNTFCSIPIGADFPSSSINGAYFDYYADTAEAILLSLSKQSYSGSWYVDQTITTATGQRDTWVAAVNVKKNASSYDYLSASFQNQGGHSLSASTSVFGVAIENNK